MMPSLRLNTPHDILNQRALQHMLGMCAVDKRLLRLSDQRLSHHRQRVMEAEGPGKWRVRHPRQAPNHSRHSGPLMIETSDLMPIPTQD
jgi:hypothetical protein